MPAEWEPHAATWIAWPHNPDDWPGKFQPIPWVYAEIVRHLSRVEDVHILVNDLAAERRAASILRRGGANLARLLFHHWPTDRVWLRDSGPIFVKIADGFVKQAEGSIKDPSASLAVTNWKFNAWAKYSNFLRDDLVPHHVAQLYGIPEIKPEIDLTDSGPHRIVLEGGSIDVNGAGSLLTTEECHLSEVQQRNPGVSREQLERVFHDYLAIDHTVWLNRGIVGDDTHGHIDDIARFVAPSTIVAAVEPDTRDPNHAPLRENLKRLITARTPQGKQFTVVELPMPRPVVFRGQRLPASYANFYVANGLVLVPTFHDPSDRVALNTLAELFPGREVIGVHSVDLIWGLGALHCMTQQQPAAVPSIP
jgi:agmatine deiminase